MKEIIAQDMAKMGVTLWDIVAVRGDTVEVSFGLYRCAAYYTFKDGELISVNFD